MKKTLPSLQYIFNPKTFISQTGLFFCAVLFSLCNLQASAKPNGGSTVPSFTYPTPQAYIAGTAIAPLVPTGSNVGTTPYSTPVTAISGLAGPKAVGVDANGTLYVLDSVKELVYKITAGTTKPVSWSEGFTTPSAMAVDENGNVYIADAPSKNVLRKPINGGKPVVVFTDPQVPIGMAATGPDLNNLYIVDGSSYVISYNLNSDQETDINAGLVSPTAVAVDVLGKYLYVTDPGNNAVYKISTASPYTKTLLYTDTNYPNSVSVDAQGNVYVTDKTTNSVEMIPIGGAPLTIASGLTNAASLCIFSFYGDYTSTGNIYICNSGSQLIKEISRVGGYYLTTPLPAGLTFDVPTGTISGTPTVASPPTSYPVTAYNADTSATGSVNIKVGSVPFPTLSYATPQTYTRGVPITPLAPASSNVAAFKYSAPVPYVNENFDGGSVFDAAGNIFTIINNSIVETPADGSPVETVVSGLSNPVGLAVGVAGNFYVAEYVYPSEYSHIVKYLAGGGAPITIGTIPGEPISIGVDAAGNTYALDEGSTVGGPYTLLEIAAGTSTPVTISTNFITPTKMVVDHAGDIFISDEGMIDCERDCQPYGWLIKFAAGTHTISEFGDGYRPSSVAVDAAGNAFFTHAKESGGIQMLPANGSYPVTVHATSINSPLVCDDKDNLYINGQVLYPIGGYFSNSTLPLGINFDVTTGIFSGTPTTVTPAKNYNVTAYNGTGGATATVNITISNAVNDTLSNLTVNTGTLTPAFSKTTTSYSDDVVNTTDSVQITPTAIDTAATIQVNGVTVISGTAINEPVFAGGNIFNILVTAQDGSSSQTYTLNIHRAKTPLTVTAKSTTGVTGSPLPALTLSYSGFIDGDTPAVLDIKPEASTTATSSSPQGYYPITVTGGVSDKYTFTYVSGTLTMASQSLVTTPIPTQTYGNADFYEFGQSAAGITYTSSNTAVATIVNGKIHIVGAGTSTIVATNGTSNISKTLTVNKATLTVSANNNTGIQGYPIPAFTINYSGFVNGDNIANSIILSPVAGTTAVSSSPSGNYPITVSGGSSANYMFSYVSGTFTLAPASYATAPIPTQTYGNADFYPFGIYAPGVTYTSSNSAVATIVSGKIHITGPGTSTINMSNGSNSINKTLTVNPATLTITADNKSKLAGAANPPLTISYSGFVNGEDSTVLSALPVASTIATVTSPAGSYEIDVSGAAAANYTFVYVAGTLTVTNPGIQSPDNAAITGPQVIAAVSPNGDGKNDVLTIANIERYPDNKVMLINSSGAKVFEVSGYDNVSKVFNGHSNIDGKMQLAGTYFYELQYRDNGVLKSKTGYVVLKY